MSTKILKSTIQKKKRKALIVFDDVIADMISNKKHNSVVTELYIRGRKINVSHIFITQSYFKVSRNIRLNCTLSFILKIAINHSSDIDFTGFMKTCKKFNAEPYSFLVHDKTLS